MKIKYTISTRHFGQHDLGVTIGTEEIVLAFSRQLDRIRLLGESQDSPAYMQSCVVIHTPFMHKSDITHHS